MLIHYIYLLIYKTELIIFLCVISFAGYFRSNFYCVPNEYRLNETNFVVPIAHGIGVYLSRHHSDAY